MMDFDSVMATEENNPMVSEIIKSMLYDPRLPKISLNCH